ncbi:helix-turn-helix transcriptional regulator [Actinomadura madurae]|uniref:helix-turn-helix domain-containing protein n=1 Tax=Actinomadura madurae TaxID=1993 RepID=UPI002027615C|nr:helix-turn-helix transcriptional regulator [Actinomadura madurae]URM93993.1 helix-turn-helix transcriptional regulator [Actinomadura madurae]
MKHDTPETFSTYLKNLRQQRKLGIRELARKASINPSVLTRLEQGKTSPMPETLRALASALEVPTSEIFAAAGYMSPAELPTISTYLRVRYGDLSDEKVVLVEQYIRRLMDERRLDPNGPADFEDEIEKPQAN